MCGRYLLRNVPYDETFPWRDYWKNLNLQFRPRYNIAPSQTAVILCYDQNGILPQSLAWGFKPSWSKYQPMINARAEGLLESKMFKTSALKKRCLIPADGFYEPEGEKGEKNRPWHLFETKEQSLFTMAGIWTESGYCIITTEANHAVSQVHKRMPLIIDEHNRQNWLDKKNDNELELGLLLNALTSLKLKSRPVSDTVKNPKVDSEECISEKPFRLI